MPHFIQKKSGFTIIELMVVVAIIGLLSSVILASLNGARVKARDAKRLSEKQQIKLALELAYDDLGQYPSSGGTWKCLGPGGLTCWNGSYISSADIYNNLSLYLPQIPTPDAVSGNRAHDAYLYYSDHPSGVLGGPPGTYLIWYQEQEITAEECNTNPTNYDAYWYCYEWMGG